MSYGMGLQVSCGVDSEVPEKGTIRESQEGDRAHHQELARQKESEVLEGKLVVDHVHVLLSVPPKYAVAQVVGFIKGKSAIYIARMSGRRRNFVGQSFWARGYCVSTIGLDEQAIRAYIQAQEETDRRLDQMKLFEKDK